MARAWHILHHLGQVVRSRRILARYLALLVVALATTWAWASGEKVTEEQLAAVWSQVEEAGRQGFTTESLVDIYRLDNATAAVKQLVDAYQSNPGRAISPEVSARMEAVRQAMNMQILKDLARINGGRIEVLNFGKQNGIRSDKDQTIYAMDGLQVRSAAEMKEAFEASFHDRYGIDVAQLDMTIFDGDAFIPDWRQAQCSYSEFIKQFKKGQAKLEANPEAYSAAGAYRAQVDRRSFEAGQVIIIEWDEQLQDFRIIENEPASQHSSRYSKWERHVTTRNAMGAVYENRQRFQHSADFIDRMKYFNRTVGDGMIGLTEHWHKDYIFHLHELRGMDSGDDQRRKIIGDIVDRNFRDLPPAEKAVFARVIEAAAMIESDKMGSNTKSLDHYMREFRDLLPESERQGLSDEELTRRVERKFYETQELIMQHGLVEVTREKLRRDWTELGLRVAKNRYGEDAAKKLRWETANEIKRVIHGLEDHPELVQKIIDAAPPETRKKLQTMHDCHQKRLARTRRQASLDLAEGDPQKARTTGPEERDAIKQRVRAGVEEGRRRAVEILDEVKQRYSAKWSEFRADLDAGKYSDEAISRMVRERVMNELGIEEQLVFNKLKADYDSKYSLNGQRLLSNVLDLGNVDAVLNIIKAYQQSGGDVNTVGMAVLWELVSKVPGVSQVATLKQSLHDGDYVSLSWLFVAWRLPAAGHVKLVFDVAKSTMEVLYHHAMEPLKNDRFTAVYMGYIEPQPAGWSPLVPGWKERRDAHQQSILAHVPGETFAQKRSNMYTYFRDILAAKLRDRGYAPTDDDYWEKLHDITPAFFGRYVNDYFNAEGDWTENTSAGLYDIGNQQELKRRLVGRLVQDFRSGQNLQWQADAAREEMEEAIRNAQAIARRSLADEREVEIGLDFVADLIGDDHVARLERYEQRIEEEPEELPAAPRIAVEVSPPVVLEQQDARLVVKVDGPAAEDGELAYDVQLLQTDGRSLLAGKTDVTPEELTNLAGANDFVQPLLDDRNLNQNQIFATDLKFEAVITDRATGAEVARQPLSLRLIGAEPPDDLDLPDTLAVRLRTGEQVTVNGRTKTMFRFEKLTPENSRPWNVKRELYLLARWPNCPKNKYYQVVYQVTGGYPPTDREIKRGLVGYNDFSQDRKPGGNAFITQLPIDHTATGSFDLKGELQAFEPAPLFEESGVGEPAARLPFSLSFETGPTEYAAEGDVLVSPPTTTIRFEVKNVQPGLRVAKIEAGSKTRYAMFSAGAMADFSELDAIPATANVSFVDYGQEVSLTIPLKTSHVGEKLDPAARNASTLEYLAQLKQKEQENLHEIGRTYYSLAGAYRSVDYKQWLEHMNLGLKYMEQAEAAIENPNWAGYTSKYRSGMSAQEKQRIRESIHKDMRGRLTGFRTYYWQQRLDLAIDLQRLDEATICYESWLAAVAAHEKSRTEPDWWRGEQLDYLGDLEKLLFVVKGDLNGAYQRYLEKEKIRSTYRGQFDKPKPFQYRPADGFGYTSPGPDVPKND